MSNRPLFATVLTAAGVVAVTAMPAGAAFMTPTDWSRPASDVAATAARTTYQEWNVFGFAAGPNNPDVGEVNPNPGVGPNLSKANAYDTTGGGLISSGGNIYSPAVATRIDVDVPSYGLGGGYVTDVLLQVRTLGTELAYDAVRLTYLDAGGAQQSLAFDDRDELARTTLGPPGMGGGVAVETLFRFSLPGSPTWFKLHLDAAESSLSTDRIAVDTFTVANVPEPAVASTALLAGAGLLLRRRRAATARGRDR